LEQVLESPPAYVDVGHTPAAVAVALEALRSLAGPRPIILVTGVSADKEAEGILEQLVPAARVIICTSACHRGRPAEQVLAIVRNLLVSLSGANGRLEEYPAFSPVLLCCSDISAAVEEALRQARDHAGVVYVAGGLFLAIEAATALRGGKPEELVFF
jgi:dihydrofolate synthase/folylpolyglutamate synthase